MRKGFLALGMVLLLALCILRALDPGPVAALRDGYFDMLQRLHPREASALPVRVVDIDEASLAALGQWPWPRDRLADLVDAISGYGAAAIVFDVLFPEPDRMSAAKIVSDLKERGLLAPGVGARDLAALDNDLRFAQAIAASNVVLSTAASTAADTPPIRSLAGFVEIGDQPALGLLALPSAVPILPPLRDAAAGIGVINISPFEAATVVRRVPLVWRGKDGPLPTLSLEALRVATGESTVILVGAPDLSGFMESVRLGDAAIPTTQDGQMWVRYRHDTPDLYVPAAAVLSGTEDPNVRAALEGNIVLIGTSAAGLLDIRTTALDENVPGVSIHAQMLEQILLGDFLRRDGLIEAAEFGVLLALGLTVTAVMAYAGPVASILTGVLAALAVGGGSWLAFKDHGILLDATFPVVGGFLAFAGLAAFQFVVADRDKRMIRRSFSHYVAPSVLEQIERGGHRLALGGETRVVTVMFSDIRGFTPLSERLTPTELVEMLNRLFTGLGEEILRQDGTIDKFIGDAIMAFWNAPIETADHPSRAAEAALAMRQALVRFNAEGHAPLPVAVAVGLATGEVCVGNIGSRDRFNYTAVGETVNQAARIEAGCRAVDYDILIARETALGAAGMALLDAGRLTLKGVSERIAASVLVGDAAMARSDAFHRLRTAHDVLLAAITDDTAPVDPLVEKCRSLAASVEPGLASFYNRLPQRLGDFR